ncbi:hypothetical protein CBL_13765 [Carabus blaptoides fortunei]
MDKYIYGWQKAKGNHDVGSESILGHEGVSIAKNGYRTAHEIISLTESVSGTLYDGSSLVYRILQDNVIWFVAHCKLTLAINRSLYSFRIWNAAVYKFTV